MATTGGSRSSPHRLRLQGLVIAEARLKFFKNHLCQLMEKMAIEITRRGSAVVSKCRPLVRSRDRPLCDMAFCVASR